MTARTIPPIVSKRNHFTPADELVEDAVGFLPDQYKHENFRGWLTRYTETVIKSVASHFGLAAQRGIEQTANLLCDTEFYQGAPPASGQVAPADAGAGGGAEVGSHGAPDLPDR
jgi:hypothetical protein